MEVEVSSRKGFAALAVLVLVLAACGTSANQSSQGASEGIAVHGHWTVDVVDPDGRLATHSAFENALDSAGARALGLILGRGAQVVDPGWAIALGTNPLNPDSAPCLPPGGTPDDCVVAEPGMTGFPLPVSSFNLQVTSTSDGLDLEGSVIATRTGAIGIVKTLVVLSDGGTYLFTLKEVFADSGAQINVDAGQSIEITVSLTFS